MYTEPPVRFNVYIRSVQLSHGKTAPSYSFDKRNGDLFGQLVCPPGSDLYKSDNSIVAKLRVPKGTRFPGEYFIYLPFDILEEVKKPNSTVRFEAK